MSKMAAGQIQSIYATPEDFCAIFEENMEHLYSLALLLTGDPAIAEQCFLAALGDCQNRPNVFPEWARSWSRRSIIQQAIRRTHPVGALRETDATCEGYADLDTPTRLARLSLFERFVFAMTVLEGYSARMRGAAELRPARGGADADPGPAADRRAEPSSCDSAAR